MTPKPYYQDKFCTIYHGDCLEIMPELEPYDTKEIAEEHREKHESFGAMTMPVREVPEGYKLFKTDYDS